MSYYNSLKKRDVLRCFQIKTLDCSGKKFWKIKDINEGKEFDQKNCF